MTLDVQINNGTDMSTRPPDTETALENWFEYDNGWIVFKVFEMYYMPPENWIIEPGSIITERVDENRLRECSYGINVATLNWLCTYSPIDKPIWRCRIPPDAEVVVPFTFSGKFRCSKLELIEVINDQPAESFRFYT